MKQNASSGGGHARRRRSDQHPGPGAGGAAQTDGLFCPQSAAQRQQRLGAQILPQHAADDAAVSEPQSSLSGAAGNRVCQTAAGGDGLSRPQPDPLQQHSPLLCQGVLPQNAPLIQHRPSSGRGTTAENRSIQCGPRAGAGPFQQDRPLHHGPALHRRALGEHRVGANQNTLPQRHIFTNPARGNQRCAGRQLPGAPDPRGPLRKPHIQLYFSGQCITHTLQISRAVCQVPPITLQCMAVQWNFLLNQRGKQVSLQIKGLPLRHPLQKGWRQNTDSRAGQPSFSPLQSRLRTDPHHSASRVKRNQGAL